MGRTGLAVLLLGWVLLLGQHAGAVRPVLKGDPGQHGIEISKIACESLESKRDCTDAPKCAWCVTKPEDGRDAATGYCFPAQQSKFLPPRLFDCDGKAAPGAAAKQGLHGADDTECAKLQINIDCDGTSACTWCTSSFGWDNGSCYSKAHARFMPRQMFECDNDGTAKQEYPANCALITNDDSCEDTQGCTWCAASWDTGICYDAAHSKHLPTHLFDCGPESKRVAKTRAHVAALKRGQAQALGQGEEPTGICADLKHAADCDDAGGCTWCTNPWGPSLCYAESQAKFLPKQYFKCDSVDRRLEDDEDDEDDEEDEENQEHKHTHTDEDEDEDEEHVDLSVLEGAGEVEVARVECSGIKDDVACDDEENCTWCTSDFLDKAACFSKTTAQYLPKVFVCDEDDGKKTKGSAAAAEAAAAGAAAAGAALECEDNKYRTKCDGDEDCTWCTSSFADKGSCFTKTAAKFLPPQMFDCSEEEAEVQAGAEAKLDCLTYKEEDGCDGHTECTWCVSTQLGKGACLTKSAAKILPPKMFTCDALEAKVQQQPQVGGEAAAGKVDCVKVTTQEDCDDISKCTWCDSSLLGTAACVPKSAAKLLPPSMFSCDGVEAQVQEAQQQQQQEGAGNKLDCVGEKTQEACDDIGQCTWCVSSLLGKGACLTKSAAKILPPTMFTCDSVEVEAEGKGGVQGQQQQQAGAVGVKGSGAVDCLDIKAQEDCDDYDDCTWCLSTLVDKAACVTKAAAKILPPSLFDCDAVELQPQAQAQAQTRGVSASASASARCMGIKDDDDCEHAQGCSWCASSLLGKGACFATADAESLPRKLFKCEHEEDDEKDEDEDEDEDEEDEGDEGVSRSRNNVDCQPIKDEYSCDDERDCTWCTSSFLDRGGCFPKAVAKYLPPHLFTCDGVPSRHHRHHHSEEQEQEQEQVQEQLKKQEQLRDSTCDKLPEDACVSPACVWCTSAAVGGGCFSPEEAAKLPSAIFNCKTAPS